MKRSSGIRQEISKRSSVETEEERAENRALWNTGRNGSRRREMRIYRNRMRAVMKIRRKKGKSRTRNTKVGRESGEEDLVVDSVEGRREIKEEQEQRLFAGQRRGVDHCRCEEEQSQWNETCDRQIEKGKEKKGSQGD